MKKIIAEGGVDFWPGEYSKTYVYADKNHDSIMAALRSGQIFVTTGHLISELYVDVSNGVENASIGGEIEANAGSELNITIRILDPDTKNPADENPQLARVTLF